MEPGVKQVQKSQKVVLRNHDVDPLKDAVPENIFETSAAFEGGTKARSGIQDKCGAF